MQETIQKVVDQHPLQRLKSPSREASAFLHVRWTVAGLASFAYSFFWLVNHPNPINQAYGWHFQYLTIIGLSLAACTFSVGLLADITLSRPLFTIKNTLSIASSPLAILISLLYWGLRAVDERLVIPPDIPRLPFSADLSFHAVPALGLIIDLLLFSPPYAISTLPALALSSAIAIAYWFWTETCFKHNGFYAYPIFAEAGYYGRIGLFVGSAVVMTVSTLALKFVYARVNGMEMDMKAKPRKTY